MMNRGKLLLVVGALMGAGGWTFAHLQAEEGRVKVLSTQTISEQLDGKEGKATVVQVTLEPGQSSPSHRHPGSVVGYILEGEYEWGIDDQPTKVFKAGDTFFEPKGCLHRVSKNPSAKGRTRVIAVVLHPHDAERIVLPAH
jgi:quercetin dioxygenase-like cupin family protein